MYLRDVGETEVGGFGVSAEDDLLLIEDVRLIAQKATVVSVEFDDNAVADYYDEQVDAGLSLQRTTRVWLHSHPGDSANPSSTDEETFHRVFGGCDWAVMAIIAKGGETYARLRFNAGPGGECELPVQVDYTVPFPAADYAKWIKEYERCVNPIDVWHEPAGITHDAWDWPVQVDAEDFEFLEHRRIDEDDEYGSLLSPSGVRPAGEVD